MERAKESSHLIPGTNSVGRAGPETSNVDVSRLETQEHRKDQGPLSLRYRRGCSERAYLSTHAGLNGRAFFSMFLARRRRADGGRRD